MTMSRYLFLFFSKKKERKNKTRVGLGLKKILSEVSAARPWGYRIYTRARCPAASYGLCIHVPAYYLAKPRMVLGYVRICAVVTR